MLKDKKRIIYSVALFLFLSLLYLHLAGEGYLLVIAHSMMKQATSTGFFEMSEGGSRSIDCAELYKKFPELIDKRNVITNPIPLDDGSGLYERFFKIDKSAIDTSNLTWSDQMKLSMAGSESKCGRGVGRFIDAVMNAPKK